MLPRPGARSPAVKNILTGASADPFPTSRGRSHSAGVEVGIVLITTSHDISSAAQDIACIGEQIEQQECRICFRMWQNHFNEPARDAVERLLRHGRRPGRHVSGELGFMSLACAVFNLRRRRFGSQSEPTNGELCHVLADYDVRPAGELPSPRPFDGTTIPPRRRCSLELSGRDR